VDPAIRAIAYARKHRARFVDELAELIAFPSVSSDARRAGDLRSCAAWLADHLARLGLTDVNLWPASGHPLVWGRRHVSAGAPTLLVYGHYDVQPEGARAAWQTPPFRGTVRGSNLYGRGASDDKGQAFAHIKALESYLATGELPINVSVLLDGEEEIGSPGLVRALMRGDFPIRADAIVISDTRIPAPDRPALTYSLRGNLQLELEISGPARDLHSGYFGGSAPNPLEYLGGLIARLHAPDGRVALDGFYDRVRGIPSQERAYMAARGPSDAAIVRAQGSPPAHRNRDYSLYERTTALPSLTVTRITTEGNAGRATIPSRAVAWIDIRLVPEQDAKAIAQSFRDRVAALQPDGLRAAVRPLSATPWVALDRRGPIQAAAAAAYRRGFGSTPVFLRSGGSIGVVAAFQRTLRVPIVLMGFGLPGDGAHGPNEKFHLPNFFRGIETSIWFMRDLRRAGLAGKRA